MDAYQFTYRPRKEAISYLHVCRPAGHRGHRIHMHDHHELVLVSSVSTCRMISNGNSLMVQTPAVFVNRAGSFHEVVAVEEGFYDSHDRLHVPRTPPLCIILGRAALQHALFHSFILLRLH